MEVRHLQERRKTEEKCEVIILAECENVVGDLAKVVTDGFADREVLDAVASGKAAEAAGLRFRVEPGSCVPGVADGAKAGHTDSVVQ